MPWGWDNIGQCELQRCNCRTPLAYSGHVEHEGDEMPSELRVRTLHLVDLENLLGDRREDEIALEGLRHYLVVAGWAEGDHVMVAAHPEIVRQIGFAPPVPSNLHAARGDDAADVMLLAHAPVELITRRYDRLVIGSGDGIFLNRARAARELRVGVLVVARADGVADRYRRWSFPIQPFDLDAVSPDPIGVAA